MLCMAGPSGDDEEKSRDIIAASTGYKYCYSDASPNGNQNNIQTHLQNFGPTGPAEMYNLSTTMVNMIGFPSKNLLPHHDQNGSSWNTCSKPTGPSSSSKEINHDDDESAFYNPHDFINIKLQHHHDDLRELMLVHEQPSLRSSSSTCVFPCEGNERPSHGLSLSLSSSNPSNIGLHSFELRQQQQQDDDDLLRFGPPSSSSLNNIWNSRYLGPAQELLSEFCNMGTKQNNNTNSNKMKDNENSIKKQYSLYSLDLLELHTRKTKLLQMLQELDRRYRHYCDQMKSVISSFESVAGNGAAAAYSGSASKAMSRHFRCLKDGILSEIKVTKKAMGEKDSSSGGGGGGAGTMRSLNNIMKGETPRLRVLDQTLRQQRALQQMDNMENIHPWRPQRGLPERSVSLLRAWLFEHFLHPYPSDVDKHILARQTGLSRSQVSNWFINARVRLWKPMVEEMYLEELKEEEEIQAPNDDAAFINNNLDDNGRLQINDMMTMNPSSSSDQKPTHDQLARIDSQCLSSIINVVNPADKNAAAAGKNKQALQNHPSFAGDPSFVAMGYGFSSYGDHTTASAGGGGGVSLTLGLHQHGGASGGGGMNLPFSHQSSIFYPRDEDDDDDDDDDDQIEDCGQTVVVHEYSLLDGESQNLPYRNLMGAQLLHDLAG